MPILKSGLACFSYLILPHPFWFRHPCLNVFPLGFKETIWDTQMRGIHAAPDLAASAPQLKWLRKLRPTNPQGHGWPIPVPLVVSPKP